MSKRRVIKLTPLEQRMYRLYTHDARREPKKGRTWKITNPLSLQIGNQRFTLDYAHPPAAETAFMRKMLAQALARLVEAEIEEWNRAKVHGRDKTLVYNYEVRLPPIKNVAEYKRLLANAKTVAATNPPAGSMERQLLTMATDLIKQYELTRKPRKK